MKNPPRFTARLALLWTCLLLQGYARAAEIAQPQGNRTIRWVVSHFRDDESFNGLLDGFARSLHDKSKGRLKVEFVNVDAGTSGAAANKVARQRLLAGEADMGQLDVIEIGAGVIETAYLFRSYKHAESVWRGPLGERLLGEIAASTDGRLRGLAFSYSGGYRILVGGVPVRKAADFKGLRMRNNGSGKALFEGLGVETAKLAPEENASSSTIALAAAGRLDLEETEVNRMAYFKLKFPDLAKRIKFVNVTRHSMLVTSMVVNEGFFTSLDAASRRLVEDEVRALAAAERKLSVSLAERNLKLMAKDGMTIVHLPKAEEAALAAMAAARHKASSEAAMIREIKAVDDVETPGAGVTTARR